MNLGSLYKTLRYLPLVIAVAFAGTVAADSRLTPETYVEIDLSAQAVTVEGVYQRLIRLQEDPYDDENQLRVGQLVQDEVSLIFDEYGVTQREFLKYGAEHGPEIEAWLDQNPAAAREYADLEQRRTSLSNQIRAIKE